MDELTQEAMVQIKKRRAPRCGSEANAIARFAHRIPRRKGQGWKDSSAAVWLRTLLLGERVGCTKLGRGPRAVMAELTVGLVGVEAS